jgi:hypothetical protein
MRTSLKLLTLTLVTAGAFTAHRPASAQTAYSIDINTSLSRVGDGSTKLSSGASQVFIDNYLLTLSYTTSGSGEVGAAAVSIPTLSAKLNSSLASGMYASGTDGTQGVLTANSSRSSLLLGGATSTGQSQLGSWSGRDAANGILTPNQTPIGFNASAGALRGSASPGGSVAYTAVTGSSNQAGGIMAGQFNGSSSPLLLNGAGMNTDVRRVGIGVTYGSNPNGLATDSLSVPTNLYYSAGNLTGGTAGIYQLGNGLPITGNQSSSLIVATHNGATPNSFFFADLSIDVAGTDTLYVTTQEDGIQKYAKAADGNWIYLNSIGTSITANPVTGVTTKKVTSFQSMDGLAVPSLSIPDGTGGTVQTQAGTLLLLTGTTETLKTKNGKTQSDTYSVEFDAFLDVTGYNTPMLNAAASLFPLLSTGDIDPTTESLRGVAFNQPITFSLPVDEPQTVSMLLASLGLMSLTVMRRQRIAA